MGSSRRKFLIGFGTASFVSRLPVRQARAQDTAQKISTDTQKIAIQGYDPVAYFTEGKPIKGSRDFEYQWQGARWLFASPRHLELFSTRPESYAPQFGGFCAGAIADGVLARPDPEAWVIVDGKLYLNGSKAGLVDWKQDAGANILKAQEKWDDLGH
jgi:YHS domain-containing protein